MQPQLSKVKNIYGHVLQNYEHIASQLIFSTSIASYIVQTCKSTVVASWEIASQLYSYPVAGYSQLVAKHKVIIRFLTSNFPVFVLIFIVEQIKKHEYSQLLNQARSQLARSNQLDSQLCTGLQPATEVASSYYSLFSKPSA